MNKKVRGKGKKEKPAIVIYPKTLKAIAKFVLIGSLGGLIFMGGRWSKSTPTQVTPTPSKEASNQPVAENPNNSNPTDIDAVTKLAKEFAQTITSDSLQSDIEDYKNLILFINNQEVPKDFDIQDDFARVVTNITNINLMPARNKLVSDKKITDTRVQVDISKLFANERDRVAVKYIADKQQEILDAIYDDKSDKEVNEMVNKFVNMAVEIVMERKDVKISDEDKKAINTTITGFNYNELTEKAQYVIDCLCGGVIVCAPNYSNINNISEEMFEEKERV